MIAGGGVAETELAVKLSEWSKTLVGMKSYCVRAYAEVTRLDGLSNRQLIQLLSPCSQALEVVPYTLAENAGLNPINIVTELRKAHVEGKVLSELPHI